MTSTNPINAAVLTVSDRCARGLAQDTSGPALTAQLRSALDARIIATRCLPDDCLGIEACFVQWAQHEPTIDLVLSTGGTGLAPRDVTPEAARRVIEREHPGLMELARVRCLEHTPLAFLSRGVAGSINRTLILTLPGSPRGALQTLNALLDVLPHAIDMLRGQHTSHDEPRRD